MWVYAGVRYLIGTALAPIWTYDMGNSLRTPGLRKNVIYTPIAQNFDFTRFRKGAERREASWGIRIWFHFGLYRQMDGRNYNIDAFL